LVIPILHEAAFICPETEAGVRDEEYFFAIYCLEAVLEDVWIIELGHGIEVAVVEAGRLNFLPGEMAGAVGDAEAALGGAVDEVRGGAEVSGEFWVVLDGLKGAWGAAIAVLADELVDGGVLAKFFDSGGEDDEFSIISKGHASAVDGLVAEPGAFEFVRVKLDDGLLDFAVHHDEVDPEAEGGGEIEALNIIADEEAAQGEAAICVFADDGQDVDNRQVLGKIIGCVVENSADWSVGAAHYALHSINGTEVVAAVDAHDTAGADEDIFVVVSHADDLMWDDLTDGKDEVETALDEELIDLCGPVVVDLTVGLLKEKF